MVSLYMLLPLKGWLLATSISRIGLATMRVPADCSARHIKRCNKQSEFISINKNEEAPILEFFSFFLCKKLHSKQAPIELWNKWKSRYTICCKEKLTLYRAYKSTTAHEDQFKRDII